MKSLFAKTDNSTDNIFIYFQKSCFFLLCIPSNINKTAVGLFLLSNNNLNTGNL